MQSERKQLAWDDDGKIVSISADATLTILPGRPRWFIDHDGERMLQYPVAYGSASMGRIWLNVPEVRRHV